MKKGFTLVELLLAIGIFSILAGLGAINYFSTLSQTSVGSEQDILIADLRSAQAKAMSGVGVAGALVPSWGIKFLGSSYVIFPGPTYTPEANSNYVVTVPSGTTITTTFPSSQVQFARRSGEILSYNQDTDTITLTVANTVKNIELNSYGVIVGE
jgi:prepilin-type N-terminal cleavage/methylation domain-containing protein